jgi:4-hydroxy-tetrahydrodipicolinate reductase
VKKTRVAQFGLGPIGLESLRFAAGQPWIEIVGAVDNDPQKYGRSLVELTGLGSLDGLSLCPTLEELFRETQPDVILHTATSRAAATLQQVRPALELGLAVASTCEELIYPALKSPAVARELDVLCRYTKARIVGTGVNPGFVMDLLPICLTGVSRTVDTIRVERIVNASTRRQSLQAKIGSGQDVAAFRQKLQSGQAGHAGLQESAALLAHAMGWQLDGITERSEPVVATADIRTEFFAVAAGQTCGIHQRVVGVQAGVEKIVLDISMYLDAPGPRDVILIGGRPELNVVINGGVAGDDATIASLINVVPRLLAAPPGLRLLHELAAPAWAGGLAQSNAIPP